jgi:hypothetical protein
MEICKHIQTKTRKEHQILVLGIFTTSRMILFSKLRRNMLPPSAGWIHVVQTDVWITVKGVCVDYIEIISASTWTKMLPWRWKQNFLRKLQNNIGDSSVAPTKYHSVDLYCTIQRHTTTHRQHKQRKSHTTPHIMCQRTPHFRRRLHLTHVSTGLLFTHRLPPLQHKALTVHIAPPVHRMDMVHLHLGTQTHLDLGHTC